MTINAKHIGLSIKIGHPNSFVHIDAHSPIWYIQAIIWYTSHMMKKILFTLSLLLMSSSLSYAQTQTGTLLPEIDPQDIEIRGDFRVRFANLIRQPILGFTNNQRLYALDPNRLPFMESEEQIRANMPIDDLDRPVAPTRRRIIYPQRTSLYAKGGFGRFNSPEASASIEAPIHAKTSFMGGFTYDGGGGHTDENSAYRLMNFQGGISTKMGGRGNLRLMGTIHNDFNDTNNPDVQKDYMGAGIKAQYRRVTNTLTHTDVIAGYDYLSVGANNTKFTNTEHRFTARSTTQWAGNRVNDIFLVHGRLDVAQNKGMDGVTQSWALIGLMPSYQMRQNYSSRITIGGRLYYGTDISGSKPFIYPDVKGEYFGLENIIVTGHLYGEATNMGLEGLHNANRFVGFDMNPENDSKWVADGRFDLNLLNAITVSGGIQYRLSPKYGYFQKSQLLVPGALYNILYDNNMRQLRLQAGAQITIIPSLLTLHGTIYNQNHKLDDGSKVPFIENTGLIAETQITPFRRIALKSWVHYIGDRETGVEDEVLNSYVLLNVQAEIMVAEQVGVYMKGLNLLGSEYQLWKGYTERPLQLYAGVVIKF